MDSAEGDEEQQSLEARRAELDRDFETLSKRLEQVPPCRNWLWITH